MYTLSYRKMILALYDKLPFGQNPKAIMLKQQLWHANGIHIGNSKPEQ